MLKRVVVFAYGVASYGVFFATFLYSVGFIGDLVVPKTMDSPARMSFLYALGIDVLLLGIFAVQHSLMARPWFKRTWTRVVPEPAERSTYVLFSSLALIALFAFWQPLGGTVWNIENPTGRSIVYQLFGLGFGLVLIATFLINHFDLFGLRQVWLYLVGKPYTQLTFRTPLFYKIHTASALRGMAHGVLVHTDDDGCAPAVRCHDDGVHPDGDPMGRE
jgi:methanethiol S-methyltransferase